jgi:beta-lactamase class A
MTSPVSLRAAAEGEIRRLIPYAGGETGVAALHLQTGAAIGVGEAGRYPPGSSIKMAIVLAIFDKVDRGELKLDQMVDVSDAEMTFNGVLGMECQHPGVALSLLNLIEITITRSDNTATDVLIRLAGGTEDVQGYLRREGIVDFDISLTMREALCVMHELPLPAPEVSIRNLLRTAPPEVLDARERTHEPGFDYQLGVRDHCTPLAMVELLRRLCQADRVSPRTRDLLLPIMRRTHSHETLTGRLPHGVVAGTKPGAGSGTCSDVGVVDLPGGRGGYVVSVQVKASPHSMAVRKSVVADISRLIYDYYLLTTPDDAVATGTRARP